ncbi:MAG TPA: hypothetical protein VK155_18960 [Bacteroidales bacterium]|nr:hypothetical protein [Bacteroidales bacterium]
MIRKILVPVFLLLLISCEKTFDTEILKFYGDAYENIGYSVAKGPDGYLIAGQYTRIERTYEGIKGSLKKLGVIETDIDGGMVRLDTTSLMQPSCGTRIISSDDGSFVVAGNTTDPQGQTDIYVAKFAPGGEGGKDAFFKMDGYQTANDIIKTAEGFLILGTTDAERGATGDLGNTKGKKDLLFLRINNDLSVISSVQTGFTGNDEGAAIKLKDNGFIIVGTTDRYRNATGNDVFVLSTNSELDISPTSFRFIQKSGNQSAADFEVLSDGLFIAGTNESDAGMHGYAWRITGGILGNITSENEISFGEERTIINSICPYKTNSFLMAGQYGSASSGSMLIFATDMLGFPVQGKSKIAGGTGNQTVHDVITDGEDIIVAGRNSYENNSMITLLKFRF